MDLDSVSKIVTELLNYVSSLPAEFQVATYEILLKIALQKEGYVVDFDSTQDSTTADSDIIMPIDVKAFLKKYELSEDSIHKVFFIAGSEIRPVYKITTTQKSKAQMQVSGLFALQSALDSGKFEFSIGSVKKYLKELKAFDKNFNANYRNNAKFFKELKDLKDEEHVELSEAGKEELAKTITSLTIQLTKKNRVKR